MTDLVMFGAFENGASAGRGSAYNTLPLPSHVPAASSSFCLDLDDKVLGRVLLDVGRSCGWSHRPLDAMAIIVTDKTRVAASGCVLVVPAAPVACRRSIMSIDGDGISGVMLASEPERLADVLAGIAAGWCMIAPGVIALAREMPDLSERQVALCEAVLAGQSNHMIARATHVSDATVKRQMAEVYRTLDVPNRAALVGHALRLGLQPRGARP